jgi:hypothetical protein
MLGLIRHMTDVRRWWFRRGHLADDVPALIEEQQWQLPADATDVDAGRPGVPGRVGTDRRDPDPAHG